MSMGYKKDIFGTFAYEFELLHKSRRKPCISSIPQELHIIKTKFCISPRRKPCISSLRKKIQPTADDIHLRWWYPRLHRDDIPLLSQWIKKRQVDARRSEGQFCKNAVYFARDMPYSCFFSFYAVLRISSINSINSFSSGMSISPTAVK